MKREGLAQTEETAALERGERGGLFVHELRKTFRHPAGTVLEILRGVSLTVAAGESVAIMGASGAGKSTLLYVLGGLEASDSGSARLDGFELTAAVGKALTDFRRRQLGFVFQFHRLLPGLTAAENVALPLMLARQSRRDAIRAAGEMLERMNLGDRTEHAVGELSGGEQQRVAVARALISRPRLVLADEPTGNLDERTGAEVGALLLASARRERTSLLVATHNEELARACDRRLLLHEGRIEDPQAR